MTKRIFAFAVVLFFSAYTIGHAQAPPGSTGQCMDGTYSNAKSKSGACSGHKGVQTWYANANTASAGPAPATAGSPTSSPKPATSPAPVVQGSTSVPSQSAGGGPGQVWVNTSTKVYHCSGDRYYGKTKSGAYMSESDAIAKGARPDAGKSCSK